MSEGTEDILSIIQPETPSAGGTMWQRMHPLGLPDGNMASAGL
jgi:hypothetical protein